MSESYFPSSSQEALAMLYMQSQDLSGKRPEDLAVMYRDAYDEIQKKWKELEREKAIANNAARGVKAV